MECKLETASNFLISTKNKRAGEIHASNETRRTRNTNFQFTLRLLRVLRDECISCDLLFFAEIRDYSSKLPLDAE